MERNHRLPSLLSSGPAQGWTRWFFTQASPPPPAACCAEPDLMQRQEAFDIAAWRNAHAHPSLPAPARPVPPCDGCPCSADEPAALPQWLQLCEAASTPTHLLVAPGRPAHAVQQALEFQAKMRSRAATDKRRQL